MSPRTTLDDRPREAVIDGFTHGGEGVARVDGKAVFVAGALPGERVVLRVVDDRKRWARADLVEVVEPSPDRVTPPCPYVPACGGCDLQHASVEAQLRLKTRVVVEQLTRLGGVDDPPVVDARSVGPATGYRAQARMHADADGHLGFHRAGSDEVVAIDRCLVLTAPAQALRERVGDDTGAEEVELRVGDRGEVATLSPGPGPLQLPDGDFDLRLEQPDGTTVAMRGTGAVTMRVAGYDLEVPADAFFQVGTAAAQALVDTVLAAVGAAPARGAAPGPSGQEEVVWDLYAGVGLLSLPLAATGRQVLAVEGNPVAAEAAQRNAGAHGLALEVITSPVGPLLGRARRGEDRPPAPDVVVLDPPRTGAGQRTVDDLVALAPRRIVYVACDVAALARDTAHLTRAGYRLTRAEPLDLFPMTHHVEVVASFDAVDDD
ncbi:MAG: class I SAM-dependent RNA methyltransferase [Nitriliruptoraceae bacterium]